VVARALGNGASPGGLAFAFAYYASSSSYDSFGARLAFRGEIVIDG
jgi:hypothetical protein